MFHEKCLGESGGKVQGKNRKLRFLLTLRTEPVVGVDESGSVIEVKRKVFFLRAAQWAGHGEGSFNSKHEHGERRIQL